MVTMKVTNIFKDTTYEGGARIKVMTLFGSRTLLGVASMVNNPWLPARAG